MDRPELSEELLAVVSAVAAVIARRKGMTRPAVTRVAPAATDAGPSPWTWAGRLDATAGGRQIQRRPRRV